MAAIALTRPIPPHRPSSAIGPLSSTISLEAITQSPTSPVSTPTPIPNKHIPICPPGSATASADEDKPCALFPESPGETQQRSLLFPPEKYPRIESAWLRTSLCLYKLSAAEVAAAADFTARQPMPDACHVFPWLHGLHPQNHIQQAFFMARRRAPRKTPSCLRGVALVKADGDLDICRLKGAMAPDEFLRWTTSGSTAEFIEMDPREGFSVRNFQIQAAKAAITSDIIVYGEDEAVVTKVGWDVAQAQWRRCQEHERQGQSLPRYNTFICLDSFVEFERQFPDIVAIDSAGKGTGNVLDFALQERKEMYSMTRASEISHNVWIGPTPYPSSKEEQEYSILIECSDLGRLNPGALQALAEGDDGCGRGQGGGDGEATQPPYLDFPSSGSIPPPTWSHAEADGILETCKWMYHLAHGSSPVEGRTSGFDEDGDIEIENSASSRPHGCTTQRESDREGGKVAATARDGSSSNSPRRRPRKILIHCADGYTESTLLGIAYFSYSTGRPVPEAWLNLHTSKGRNFFAYPTDVALLTAIAPRLLYESPACSAMSLADITAMVKDEPRWLAGLDGSFPSRVLDYMYLGNLGHANNPDLLRSLGIRQVLSVGETPMWRDGEREDWGSSNLLIVQGVQDNGIDPLTDEFERCLDFIDRGRKTGTATLVHCRVGVSRSATICIAEVMRALDLSFPRAYCFVRARRLNVIIQPHLRFAYELLKWEERLQARKGRASHFKRELEWGEIAREVAAMNRPYANR